MVGTKGYPDLASVIDQLCTLQEVTGSVQDQGVREFVSRNV
jgi:hypothetical protein